MGQYDEPWNVNNGLAVKPKLYTSGVPQAGDYTNSGYGMMNGADNDGGLFSSLSNSDMIDGIGGAGQLGLGLLNYFQNRDVTKAQVGALNQQVAQSQYAIDDHKKFKSGSAAAFA